MSLAQELLLPTFLSSPMLMPVSFPHSSAAGASVKQPAQDDQQLQRRSRKLTLNVRSPPAGFVYVFDLLLKRDVTERKVTAWQTGGGFPPP